MWYVSDCHYLIQWRGKAIHGFDSKEALDYSLDNAGSRFASAHEVCGKLMNGAIYANPHPPADSDEHKDFAHHVVENEVTKENWSNMLSCFTVKMLNSFSLFRFSVKMPNSFSFVIL